MADSSSQLDVYKANASRFQSQLQTATTKNEALTLAIGAAENLMKALKLTSDQDDKKHLKAQFTAVADVAERIKSTKAWSPPTKTVSSLPPQVQLQPQTQQPRIRSEEIGQWAADVANSGQPMAAREDIESPLSNPINDFANPAPAEVDIAAPNTSSASSFSLGLSPQGAQATPSHDAHPKGYMLDTIGNFSRPLNLGSKPKANPSLDAQIYDIPYTSHVGSVPSKGDPVAKTDPSRQDDSVFELQNKSPLAATPSTWSYSHIRRLAEPVSTRKRAKKEEIILLRASIINGFKCPPWGKTPASTEFSFNGTELFTDTHDLSLSAYQQQFFEHWARAKDALPPPSIFPRDRRGIGPLMSTPRSVDLVQDAATDCSVVSSLCAGIARAERGHDQILSNKIYPFDKSLGKPVISSNGKYVVRLNFNGCWRKVTIDDRLPLSSTHRLLHVVDRRQPALLWPALLEKAYLKLRGGYDFPGSNSCSDLWTFTGWIPEQVHLQETDTVPRQLWDRIYKAFMFGDVLVTLGTGKMTSRQERELGLEGQHSYVVLDMREVDHDRLLLVKNPWVEGKGWRGAPPSTVPFTDSGTSSSYSNDSLEAFHRDSIPTKDRPNPTTFWIGLEQVIRHYESLYLNWNPGLFRYRQDIHFEWKIRGTESGSGCIVTHPQFAFWSKDAEVVWFLLTRHFRDTPGETKDESDAFNDGSILPDTQMSSTGEASKGFMSIYVCNGNGERLYIKDSYLETSDYVTTPQCLLRWDTEANTRYTVVIDQDELPASSYTFSLSAFSNSEIMLEPAIQKLPIQKVVAGEWTKQTAGGTTSSPRYFENPQYMLDVKEVGPLAILLTSVDHKNPMHVKLTLGYGKRMYRLQSRDVLVDSGDHRSGCVFAELQDVQPGLYTIICSLFEAGQTGDFSLRVDSTSEVVLKQIPRDGAGLISMKLGAACFGPDSHKLAAPIVPHRLASFTIVARFLRATTPRAMGMLPAARSPFRFSVELGRGPERKFLIASERGDYTDSATIRSEPVNIDPTLFPPGDVWLVLDRLSGPGGPIEEWYEVEIFADVPQACTVGVWRTWDD